MTAPQPQSVNINISATVDYLTGKVADLVRENAILVGQNAALRTEAEQHTHETTTFAAPDPVPAPEQPLEAAS